MGILNKIFAKKEMPDIDDEQTTDNYLRYLRRENRRIQEKYEKQRLKAAIKREDQKNLRKNVYGIGDKKILKTPNMFKQKFKFEEANKTPYQILKQKNIFK